VTLSTLRTWTALAALFVIGCEGGAALPSAQAPVDAGPADTSPPPGDAAAPDAGGTMAPLIDAAGAEASDATLLTGAVPSCHRPPSRVASLGTYPDDILDLVQETRQLGGLAEGTVVKIPGSIPDDVQRGLFTYDIRVDKHVSPIFPGSTIWTRRPPPYAIGFHGYFFAHPEDGVNMEMRVFAATEHPDMPAAYTQTRQFLNDRPRYDLLITYESILQGTIIAWGEDIDGVRRIAHATVRVDDVLCGTVAAEIVVSYDNSQCASQGCAMVKPGTKSIFLLGAGTPAGYTLDTQRGFANPSLWREFTRLMAADLVLAL
jgi:hypothetical protein